MAALSPGLGDTTEEEGEGHCVGKVWLRGMKPLTRQRKEWPGGRVHGGRGEKLPCSVPSGSEAIVGFEFLLSCLQRGFQSVLWSFPGQNE